MRGRNGQKSVIGNGPSRPWQGGAQVPTLSFPLGIAFRRISSSVNACHLNRFWEEGHNFETLRSALLTQAIKSQRIFTRKTWQGLSRMAERRARLHTSFFPWGAGPRMPECT